MARQSGDEPLRSPAGQADVDQCQVEVLLRRHLQRLGGRGDGAHFQTETAQHQLDLEALCRIDQKDLFPLHGHAGSGEAASLSLWRTYVNDKARQSD